MPVNESRNYEAMVILNAQLGDEEHNALVGRLEEVLRNGGAEVREVARWGRRRMAYEIDRKKDGYYAIFYFGLGLTGGDQVLEAFERACRFDENIIRHMVLKVPVKKRGRDVTQLVPQPGQLSDFRFEPRAPMRRRYEERPTPPPAHAAAPEAEAGSAPAPEAPAEKPESDKPEA